MEFGTWFRFWFVLILSPPPSTFFFQLVLISWMVTVSSYLIWQIISFILPPYEYGCVYAWTMLGSGPAIDLQKITILAKKKIKIIFSDKVHFDFGGYVNKQNCLIWGTENPLKNRRTQMKSKIVPIMYATACPAEAAIWMKLFSIINRKDCIFK